MAVMLVSAILAGASANAMELESNVVMKSAAEETIIDESIIEEEVEEADWKENAVLEGEEDEASIIEEEYFEEAINSANIIDGSERRENIAENSDGGNTASLGSGLEEGVDVIADSDMDTVVAMSESASGKCGVDTLTISGSGPMGNYGRYDLTPWWDYMSDIVIIRIADGITEIGEWAFRGCSSLTSILIPESVTKIGEWAFRGCGNLTSILLPENVMEIGRWAFEDCGHLSNILIPEGVTKINEGTFSLCSSLESITISNSVAEIGERAFNGCSSLTNIVIPESVTKIGEGAFESCSGLESIIIPDGVTEIGKDTFLCCSRLEGITIPESVIKIGEDAFYDCYSLESIAIPDSITEIGDSAFNGCSSLTSILIPKSVIRIGWGAFESCSGLESITISKGITEIGEWAFNGCSSLTSIRIPESVIKIGGGAFEGCGELTKIVFLGNAPDLGDEIFLGDSLTAYYPANDDTWTEDVRQNYGGTVTWIPYINFEDIEGDGKPEDLLEAALSTITLSPENDAEIGGTNGDITITLNTTGQLQLSDKSESELWIAVRDRMDVNNGITYTLFGDGKVQVSTQGKEWECSWEEAGLYVDATDNSLSITMHEMYNKWQVEVQLWNGFLSINGQEINTDDEKSGKIILPWSFTISADTYDSFSFGNYSAGYISRKVQNKVFSPAVSLIVHFASLGKGGYCYGISLAEATFAWNSFPNLGLRDFKSTASNNWDLKEEDKNKRNLKENLTLNEYIQACFMAQFLPDILKEKIANSSYGDDKNVENIRKLVDSIIAFKNNAKKNPVMVHITDTEGNNRHTVLAYNCTEYPDRTNIWVIDSNDPGSIQPIKIFKENGSYTGEWEYKKCMVGDRQIEYRSSTNKKNFISFDHPITTFFNAYATNTKNYGYLLQTNDKTRVPEMPLLLRIDYSSSNKNVVLDPDLYWILEETTIPFDIIDAGNFSIAGNEVAVQYNNLQTGTVNVSMQEDNFAFTTEESGQENAEVSYLFYNDDVITKVTIRELNEDSSLEVYNKDEKIYFKGLDSAEITMETGDYDENGDFVSDNTTMKTFSNLSEEEEYEVDGSNELEHIVRVSDDAIIQESVPGTDKPLQSISLSKTDISLQEGESQVLEVLYTPDDTTDDKTVVWISSDETVATVDANGKVNGKKVGKAVVTAIVGERSAVCNVIVTGKNQPEETDKPVSTEPPIQPTGTSVPTNVPEQSEPTAEPVPTQNPDQPQTTGAPVPTDKPEQSEPTAEPVPTQNPDQPQPTGTPVPTNVPGQSEPTAEPVPTQNPDQPQTTGAPVPTDKPEQSEPTAEPVPTQNPDQPQPTGTPVPTNVPGQSEPTAESTVTQAPGQEVDSGNEGNHNNEGSSGNTVYGR